MSRLRREKFEINSYFYFVAVFDHLPMDSQIYLSKPEGLLFLYELNS